MKDRNRTIRELNAERTALKAENEELRCRLRAEEEHSTAQILRLQMLALQAHIKPHFMYNALSAIIALCYTDGEKAAELLTKFSRYLRMIFSTDPQNEMVTLRKTLELIEMYVEIEKSRFGDRLKMVSEVDPTLLDEVIIPLLLEPLIENAVRHGISKKIRGGTIRLRIRRFKSFIKVIVMDEGIGMSRERVREIMERDETAVGVGIPSINKRLWLYSGNKLRIKSAEGFGTIVVMLLPIYRSTQNSEC